MFRWAIAVFLLVLSSMSNAHADGGGRLLWAAAGAGGGFGIGVWAGLAAFDDAVNSDRKVWTSALAGAGAGAAAGYLIGRARDDRARPAIRRPAATGQPPVDPRLLERLAASVRLTPGPGDRTAAGPSR